MSVVVEPVVNEEKLRQLLDEQSETASLDYKATCDLSRLRDTVELAKDIGAMQIRGGFLVVGADDHGGPTDLVSESQSYLFDESRLRAKLATFIPEPYELRSAIHVIDGHRLALVFVGQNPRGWCVFRHDGFYDHPSGERVFVFRRGDVFARHGTASERWHQEDIEGILVRLIDEAREGWRREHAVDLTAATQGQAIARGPAAALRWDLDEESLSAAAIELLRASDDIPLRLLLEDAPAQVLRLLESEDTDEFFTLLDRLTCLAALGLRVERHAFFDSVMSVLAQVYQLGVDSSGRPVRIGSMSAPSIWLAVIERAMALGGLAVRRGDWRVTRNLILQRPLPEATERYSSWIRHAVTMSARARLLTEVQEGRQVELAVLNLVRAHAVRLPCLRPGLLPNDERILDSLCQFDALASLVAIGDAESSSTTVFYTSFARFYSHRTEPVIERIIGDQGMRAILFPPPLADDDLAEAIRAIDRMATSEGFRFADWDGFTSRSVQQFLSDHPPPQSRP